VTTTFGSHGVLESIDSVDDRSWETAMRSDTLPASMSVCYAVGRFSHLGAGEIQLQVIHRDGKRVGMALELIRSITESFDLPTVTSGKVSNYQHMAAAFEAGASAVAVGAVFLFTGLTTKGARDYLVGKGLPMRLDS